MRWMTSIVRYCYCKNFNSRIPEMRNSIFILLLIVCANGFAQSSELDSIILKHKYIIEANQKGLTGSGVQFLLNEAKNAQFVLIGENHNTKEIPEFTSSLFELLNKNYQFQYLALEQDPAMMRIVSNRNTNISDLARKYPYGFTFITDQELTMVKKVRTISSAKYPIWGCDQAFGASHSLAAINEFLKPKWKNQVIDSICKNIYKKEKYRNLDTFHYMSELDKREQLLNIKNNIPSKYKKKLRFYIDELLISDTIYTLIQTKKYFESRSMREAYMITRFLTEYNLASGKNQIPKAVLKFGNLHLNNGYNPGSYVNCLGTFVRQFALVNKKTSISINALIYRNDGSDWDYFKSKPSINYLQRFANNASVKEWTLFDLRPLKAIYYNEIIKLDITKEERVNWENLIYGYDFLLLIGNGNDGDTISTSGQY